jgi:hypothetical protein
MNLFAPILRHPVAALVVAAVFVLAPRTAAAVDPSYSGSWYRPAESGSGFNLEVFSDERALLFWYTYDDDGQPVWLYSEGDIDGERIDFTVYYSDGMTFSDPDTADEVKREWGTLTMQFLGCDDATITYQSTLTGLDHSPVGARTLPVERLVNIDTLPCRREAAGYWSGRHWDPTLDANQGGWADLSGVLTEDGNLWLSSADSGELFAGDFVAADGTVAFEYEACETDGGPCYDAAGTASYGNRDFIEGSAISLAHGEQAFELTYRTLYDREVTLESLGGGYAFELDGDDYAMTVFPDGTLQATGGASCTLQGQLAQIDTDFNAFAFTGTSTCLSGTVEGVVVNTDVVPGDRDGLEFRLTTGSSPLVFTAERL